MNYTTAVFLINNQVRAVICTYEAAEKASPTMFKTLDKTIRVGDLVIVPTSTRHGMTVVKVTDADVDVNFDDSACVQWIVGKVDAAPYHTIIGQEADAISAIKSAEKNKKRNELRDAIMADVVELKMLPITGSMTTAPTTDQSA